MNLISFNLPESVDELAPWLEAQIVEQHLAQLVAELAAIHQMGTPPAESVGAILGASELQEVLNSGLKVLPLSNVKKLLTHPYCLLELQDLVLSSGGPYWRLLPRSEAALAACSRSWKILKDRLAEIPVSAKPQIASPALTGRAWYRQSWPWIVNFATVAAILVGVYLYYRVPQIDSGKAQPSKLVWISPENLSRPASAEEYWQRLASVRQWWFEQKPADKVELALRIGELRRGCSALILENHASLSPEQRKRLITRCHLWASELDHCLVDLENDVTDFEQTQQKADALVIRMADKLQNGV